jgi:hypothetical protein
MLVIPRPERSSVCKVSFLMVSGPSENGVLNVRVNVCSDRLGRGPSHHDEVLKSNWHADAEPTSRIAQTAEHTIGLNVLRCVSCMAMSQRTFIHRAVSERARVPWVMSGRRSPCTCSALIAEFSRICALPVLYGNLEVSVGDTARWFQVTRVAMWFVGWLFVTSTPQQVERG